MASKSEKMEDSVPNKNVRLVPPFGSIADLAIDILRWPLMVPTYLRNGGLLQVSSVVAGLGVSYVVYGNPLELSYMDMVRNYAMTGTIITVGANASAIGAQYIL